MKNIDELKRLTETREFYSDAYIKRVYNTHAKSYNEKTPKREAYKDIRYVSDELGADMQSIRNSLGNYGLDPFYLPILELEAQKGNITLEQLAKNINRYFETTGLTPDDLKPIAKLSRIYLEHDANWGAIHFLMREITDNGFPHKVRLWDDISENEKKRVTKRGNPDFKEDKVDIPDGFYEDADKLKEDNPDRSRSWIEDKLIRKYFDGDKGKKSTVYRRLNEHWGK